MRTDSKLTAEQILRAADLYASGWRLTQVQAAINPDASLMVYSRAIAEAKDAYSRIEHYRKTGDVSGLSCIEAVIALSGWQAPPVEEGVASPGEK